ncbi:hypothetical protein [Pseudoalteromonas gelatinilytica]|uniref:Uncharacterized protein n=1 Tax=Pseudoalteromonas gelatinilytica TaxID=1703256 RepID=A0ABQ1TUP3_9GAMM|nr:hypothetical protein [Pseudoalteromonas profundi]GGF02981.1 hypothetical protein GCM10008027_29840 [Pseudoalteromonas profundi]
MNKKAKKTLLERKFISIIYIKEYVDGYQKITEALDAGMKEFEFQLQLNPNLNIDNFKQWQVRGAPNIKRGAQNALEHFEKAKQGHLTGIASSAANLRGLSRDVDNIGGFGEWWHEIDISYWDSFYNTYMQTETIGSNIDYTISDYWDDDEILRETITGPIDEQELLSYLEPNESLDDLA